MKYLRYKLDHHDSDKGIVKGSSSNFGNIDAYRDVVEHGAFDVTLSKKDLSEIKFLFQHNSNEAIGEHLSLVPDKEGLKQVSQLILNDHVPTADKANSLAKRGILDGLSIGYNPVVEEFDRENNINRIKEIDLMEISMVMFPANTLSRITDVKSVKDLAEYKRRIENILREAGCSEKEALDIVCSGIKAELMNVPGDPGYSEDELAELAQLFNSQQLKMAAYHAA